MKKTIIILSALTLLLCAVGCQKIPDGQPTEAPSDVATTPQADHSDAIDDDIQYVPPEGDDGIGDQWESLDDFKAYAQGSKEHRDYPKDMNMISSDGMIPVPFKRDYASEEPWVFRVLEMYHESFDRSWIWYYTQGEKGWIIVKVGKLTEEEIALSQTMTCAELLHVISPILVQPGEIVDGLDSVYEQNITVSGDYETTSMVTEASESDYKQVYFVYGEFLIRIADNGGTVDEEWLRNLDFYTIPYVE